MSYVAALALYLWSLTLSSTFITDRSYCYGSPIPATNQKQRLRLVAHVRLVRLVAFDLSLKIEHVHFLSTCC